MEKRRPGDAPGARPASGPGGGRAGCPRPALGLALLLVLAAGCGGSETDTDRAGQGSPALEADTAIDSITSGTWVFACPGDYAFAVRIAPDSAIVELVNRDVRLPRAPAASGTKYQGEDVVFRSHGSEAALTEGDREYTGCTGTEASSPWEKARMLGIELRALGQEPGWIVDVNPGRWIRYIGDYGETRMTFPPVDPARDSTGVTYRTSTSDHSLAVEFERALCHDAMSGRPFDYTVTLEVDGRSLNGCGRRLRDP